MTIGSLSGVPQGVVQAPARRAAEAAGGPADAVELSAAPREDGWKAATDATAAALPASASAGFRLIMGGPPGAGKSTIGRMLAERHHVPHISMGDLLRDEIDRGTEIGKTIEPILKRGDLVDHAVVAQVLGNRLDLPDAASGFVLDGFPRRMEDVSSLEEWRVPRGVAPVRMLELDVPVEEVLRRVENRRVCENHHTVDIKRDPPRVADHCDQDGLPLERRPDDAPATVRHRFDVYYAQTQPVLKHYDGLGLLSHVQGVGTPDEVLRRAIEKVG